MKRFLCLCLALILAVPLAGCNNAKEPAPSGSESPAPSGEASLPPSGSPSPSEEASASPLPGEVAVELLPDNEIDATADILGFPNSTVLLTVNGVEVTAEEYLYWLGNMTAYYKNLYASYYYSDLDLSQEVEEGVTWDTRLREIAYQNAVLLAIVPELEAEFSAGLTEEELSQLAQTHNDDVAQAGEDVYAYRLQAMNVNDETAFGMDIKSTTFNKVQTVWQEQAEGALTNEEVDAYVEENDLLRAKHILLLTKDMTTGEDYDDAKKAEQKAKAEDILKQLQEGGDFDALMNENSEDGGLATNPDGYVFTAGDMVTEFEEGTRALEIGGVSPELVESTYGYHIIWRLDPDCAETRSQLLEDRFNELVQSRVDSAEVVKAPEYDTFTTSDYYDKLVEFQDTLTDPSAQTNTVDESQTPLESVQPEA